MKDENIKLNWVPEDCFIIEKLPDGSWAAKMRKYGKIIEVREAKPEDCLTRLLTHDGK